MNALDPSSLINNASSFSCLSSAHQGPYCAFNEEGPLHHFSSLSRPFLHPPELHCNGEHIYHSDKLSSPWWQLVPVWVIFLIFLTLEVIEVIKFIIVTVTIMPMINLFILILLKVYTSGAKCSSNVWAGGGRWISLPQFIRYLPIKMLQRISVIIIWIIICIIWIHWQICVNYRHKKSSLK